MNTVSYFVGKGPRLKVNKPARRPVISPARRAAEQAIRDTAKRRMDSLWRSTRGRGWTAHLLFMVKLVWALQAQALDKLDRRGRLRAGL